jgi:hypothetical protein
VTLRVRSKSDAPVALLLEHAETDIETLTVGRVLEWADAVPLLATDALDPELQMSTWRGPALAIHVARGGQRAEKAVAVLLEHAGARAVQASTGWVLATLPDWQCLGRIAPQLSGALWLQAAVGYGPVLELVAGEARVIAGGLLQDLVALAQEADAGQIQVLQGPTPPDLPDWRIQTTAHATELLPLGASSPLALPTLATHALTSGDTVDARFVLGDVIGKGGFGLVYAARDAARQAEVVVKLLRHELAADPTQVQRFYDEGRLASRLTGPHAVRVHDWGMADDGRLFLAMERLDGQELSALLHTLGTLDPMRAMRLVRQAALGLAEAHSKGLIHRDIKPANLFVTQPDGSEQELVKVIDYGIALDQTGRVKDNEPPGSLIGTPLYMAPEQVTGEALDGRCDLYALALVLYQALTGRLPFSGSDVMALLMARLVQTPPPLDEVARQPLPPGLAALVEQTLARSAADRPHDAEALARALQDLLTGDAAQGNWRESWTAHPQATDLVDQDTVDAALVAALTMDACAPTELL